MVNKELDRIVLSGEIWEFPPELSFLVPNLKVGEQYEVAKWWELIQKADGDAITHFLKVMTHFSEENTARLIYRWRKQTPTEQIFPYTALFSIGSTARKEANYNDIDFLFVTNLIHRDAYEYDPKEVLEKEFSYHIDPTIGEAYLNHGLGGERSLITLTTKSFTSKKIHLTFQPEVYSLENWLEHDKEAKILLYRSDRKAGALAPV